jgi:heme oxygenase
MNLTHFESTVNAQVEAMTHTPAWRKLAENNLTVEDYHKILLTIFHQVQESAATFSLAAGYLPPNRFEARSYLMLHAEEEKMHWQWVRSDLTNTGYAGADPATELPKPATAAYIAFNYSTAMRFPIGRLAIAATLESIGAKFGGHTARLLMTQLNLTPDQVRFFDGHGDTDIGHTKDIFDVLENSQLTPDEWKNMCHIAEVAGALYRNMYTETMQ